MPDVIQKKWKSIIEKKDNIFNLNKDLNEFYRFSGKLGDMLEALICNARDVTSVSIEIYPKETGKISIHTESQVQKCFLVNTTTGEEKPFENNLR